MRSIWEPSPGEFRTQNEWAALLLVVATLAVPVFFDKGFFPSFCVSVLFLGVAVATTFWKPKGSWGAIAQAVWAVCGGTSLLVVTLFVIHGYLCESPSVPVNTFYGIIASIGWCVPEARSRRTIFMMAYLPLTFFLFMGLSSVVPQEQHVWVWLLFVGAAAALALIVGAASPSGHRFVGGSSVWTLGKALVVVVVASMVLSVPVSAVRMKMKTTNFPSFEGAPSISTSSSVVMTATFRGKIPFDPYWRGMTLVYPAPANLYGEWQSYKTVFDDVLPSEDVTPMVGEEKRVVSSVGSLRSEADYSFVTVADSLDAILLKMDGTVSTERFEWDKKKALSEQNAWGYASFRRRSWALGMGLLTSSSEAAFNEKLNREMENYLKIPGFDPSQGQVPSEMEKTYAWVQAIQAELVASGALRSPRIGPQSDVRERKAFVDAVQKYFKDHLKYNFDHQFTEKEKNTVDFLLFEDRRGVCRHFANAFAMAMRMGGVPSRVVAGFAGGAYDSSTQTYLVRERDAHAWTEVWMGWERGWVRVDPTAGISVEKGIPEPGVMAQWKEGMQFSKSIFGDFATAGTSGSPSVSRAFQGLSALLEWVKQSMGWPLAVGGGAIAVLLGLFILRLREGWAPVCPTQKAWEALLSMVRGFGYEIPVNMGPATLKTLLTGSLRGEALGRWCEAVDGYEQWRFANAAPPGLAQTIRQALPVVRRALQQERRRGS